MIKCRWTDSFNP